MSMRCEHLALRGAREKTHRRKEWKISSLPHESNPDEKRPLPRPYLKAGLSSEKGSTHRRKSKIRTGATYEILLAALQPDKTKGSNLRTQLRRIPRIGIRLPMRRLKGKNEARMKRKRHPGTTTQTNQPKIGVEKGEKAKTLRMNPFSMNLEGPSSRAHFHDLYTNLQDKSVIARLRARG